MTTSPKQVRREPASMNRTEVVMFCCLSVASGSDDASCFGRLSSTGTSLRLTLRRYEAAEGGRNGHISKQGN